MENIYECPINRNSFLFFALKQKRQNVVRRRVRPRPSSVRNLWETDRISSLWTSLLLEESKSSCYWLQCCRLHLCAVWMCLFIHQGGEGRLLPQTLGPSSYPVPAAGQEGQTPLKMHGDQWVELKDLPALHRPHQIFMSHAVCAVSGPRSSCSAFCSCVVGVRFCGSRGAPAVTEEGWVAGSRCRWVCLRERRARRGSDSGVWQDEKHTNNGPTVHWHGYRVREMFLDQISDQQLPPPSAPNPHAANSGTLYNTAVF